MADVPTLSITLLGAGQEVGRSCCVLQYRDITIVLDAGVHPAHTGMASLPFIDELDWSTVDAILVTQCAPSPPYTSWVFSAHVKFPFRSRSSVDIYHRKSASETTTWMCRALTQNSYHTQTNFREGKGKVYMTHPTKALHKFMMQDFVRMRCEPSTRLC